jgi:hypothetical protein
LRWLEPIVVAASVHMGGGFTRVNFGLISLDLVLGGQMQQYLFILKMCCSNGSANVSGSVATVRHCSDGIVATSADPLLSCCTTATEQSHSSLLCDHCSDGIVATCRLLVATVGYDQLVQRCVVVVYDMAVLHACVSIHFWFHPLRRKTSSQMCPQQEQRCTTTSRLGLQSKSRCTGVRLPLQSKQRWA